LIGLAAVPASASEADDYAAAMHRALSLVQFAERGDAPSRQQAITLLAGPPSAHQPEILADLRSEPPDLTDAAERLTALLQTLEPRTDTPNPGLAAEQLRQILNSPRYAALRTGPSLLEQVEQWVGEQIAAVLARLGIQSQNTPIAFLVVAAILLLGILVWALLSSPKGAARRASAPGSTAGPPRTIDYFAEADRLAASGDFYAAVRLLAGGVAVAISGERAWDRSPLTVREIFARAGEPARLRLLLLPFEAAAYGHRPPDAASYARAADAALPFRPGRA
jgi:hypothetical protein